ncbi:MAG: SRPBCC family protein [Myxococcaceae bacterium]
MGRVARDIELGAGRDAVWGFITDPRHFPDYVDGYAGGVATSAEPVGLGARYEWWGRVGPLRLTSIEQVVEWVPGERVRYQGQLSSVPFRSAMELAEVTARRTRLTVTIDFDVPSWLGGRVAERLIVASVVEGSVRRSLARVAQRFPPG